jgi:methylated-DNA-[protein]-cysteine S-methyltransferase
MVKLTRIEAGRFGEVVVEANERGLSMSTVDGFSTSMAIGSVAAGSTLSREGIVIKPIGPDELLALSKRMRKGEGGPYDPSELSARAASAIRDFLSGDMSAWEAIRSLPVDEMAIGEGFTGKVLSLLRDVPPGRYISYGDMAIAAGSPRAARAVGAAMASNPLLIVVPCHRVFGAGGRFTGFGGGLELKAALAGLEQLN